MLDTSYIYSAVQAITVTADSTSTVDLGALIEEFSVAAGTQTARTKMGPKNGRINLVVRVGTAFAGGTSVAFALQDSADDSTFAATPISVAATAIAALTAGAEVLNIPLTFDIARYSKMVYTVIGTMTAGTINAQLEFGSHQR